MASLDSSKRRGGDNVRTRKSEFQRGNTFNAPSLGSMHDVLHKKVINQVQIPKTEETTNLLIKALSSHFLFVSLHPKEVVELVEAMCVEVIPPGVCVVKQGESGDKFYVVQEGTFDVVLNGVVTSVAGRGSSIGPGQSFGELALIHDGPRHATLRVPKTQAGKGSVVYSLTREGFRHIVARQQAAKVTQVKETLRKVKLLEGLSDTELSTVAASVKLVDFAPGTMVIRKGEPGLEMYIIKEGDVVCEVPGASVDSTSSPESRPRSGSVVATKVPLGVGAWFGERALLFDDLRAADVVAGTTGASCYMIKKKTFKDVLGNSDEVLRKMSREVKLQSLASIGISKNLLTAAKALGRSDGPELLAKLVTLLESQSIEAGPLIEAGSDADAFYIIRNGEISLTTESETYSVGKGGCFGESALVTSRQEKYVESAVVVSNKAELFALNRSDLELLSFDDLLISAEMKERMAFSRRRSSITSNMQSIDEAAEQAAEVAGQVAELDKLSLDLEREEPLDEDASRRATEAFEVSRTVLTAPKGLEDLIVERTIGCGSFGRVKLATHKLSGTVCAIKILQKDTIVEMRQTKNISREKDIVASLTHPNVLRMYGTFQDQDCLYMMLELVNGGELYRLMHGDGSEENVLPFKDMRFYVAQVLNVYEYIHAKNIVYRDLKPENLLISPTGYLKVIDWGFAKEIADNTTYTMCGTPEYLAPEVVNCSGHGRAADFWSLGVNLFEMAVGYSPFVGDDVEDQLEICKNITSGLVEFPPDRPVDPLIEDMIRLLLTQDPTARLGCMADGVKAVQRHAVYQACNGLPLFDWDAMRQLEMEAPWIPEIPGGAKDVSNFDDIYDDEEEEIIPYDGDVVFDF